MLRALLLVALLLVAAPALAAQSVELRSDAAGHGGRVTLADLFDDAGAAGQVVLAAGLETGGQVVLDASRVQAVAAAHGLSWPNAEGLRVIITRVEAGPASSGALGSRPREAVLSYARDLQAGEVIQPDDLAWSRSEALASPLDAPRDAREVIGRAARRPLRAGAAVSEADVAAAQVIKKDDVVQVIYEVDGLRLVLEGRAIGGAGVGQPVDVLNPMSKKVIEAVASGPGQALVGPSAEALKAAARANPRQFASIR